jgi:ribosomal protein S18 acetylase RimI-like enzyme
MRSRQLSFEDREDVVALWHLVGLTRPWNDPVVDFDRAMSGPASTILGIRDNGGLVASAMVGHDGHRGWVYYVAVHPKRQGVGLGREIMEAAERWLRSCGAVKVHVMVRDANHRVQDFYGRLGYELAEVKVLARWLTPEC